MKKLLALLLSLVMVLSLCACTTTPKETTAPPAETTLPVETDPVVESYSGKMVAPTFYSETLKADWNFTAYLPASYDEANAEQKFPVIYLLHGAYGNHRNLVERFSTKDIMDRLITEGLMPEAVVVFVDGFNSYYVDGPALAMESAIINDLIPYMEATYHGLGTKEGRFIGGISMGGYGAARFAMKYPEMFNAALLMSPAVWDDPAGQGSVSGWHVFVNDEGEFDANVWAESHPLVYAEEYQAKESPVNFYIVHGSEDTTVVPEAVDTFAAKLGEIAPVEYVTYAGGIHAWTTWSITTEMALAYTGSLLTGGDDEAYNAMRAEERANAEPPVSSTPVDVGYSGKMVAPTLYSETLKLDWNFTAYLPASFDEANTEQKFPVIYLLHGAYGNHRNLVERFSTKDIMDKLIAEGKMPEAVVVFVDGFNSYYVDGPAFAMESAIINDLIPYMEATYHGLGTKEGRVIGGISMGGYGAARFGMKYPELFGSVLMMSPAVWDDPAGQGSVSGWHVFVDDEAQFSADAWAKEHPLVYAEDYAAKESPVNFYVIHGTEDTTVVPEAVDTFVAKLSEIAPVEYVKEEGGIHAWTTWSGTTAKALEYVGALLLAE